MDWFDDSKLYDKIYEVIDASNSSTRKKARHVKDITFLLEDYKFKTAIKPELLNALFDAGLIDSREEQPYYFQLRIAEYLTAVKKIHKKDLYNRKKLAQKNANLMFLKGNKDTRQTF